MACSPEAATAISRKKARYARYADTKQWGAYADEVALPNCTYAFEDVNGLTLNAGGNKLQFASTVEFTAFFGAFFAKLQTLHNLGPGDFTQTAPDEVRAVFSVEDQILAPPFGAWAEIRGGGYYYETWKMVDGDWFLSDLRMRRTYQKMTLLVQVAFFFQEKLGISML
ncbi:Uu.00g146060.m01.CDS01 [Anthostomella pinea]|uniref:Uu.00g146060.m01.CDS01 n=1 Tax=Anthostomella pinea TaxID=933095 RepID=A0AAI8VKN6_9PEZI|nr:Uu.00g146060.m01.CDS01 [Anthostomella pinea]